MRKNFTFLSGYDFLFASEKIDFLNRGVQIVVLKIILVNTLKLLLVISFFFISLVTFCIHIDNLWVNSMNAFAWTSECKFLWDWFYFLICFILNLTGSTISQDVVDLWTKIQTQCTIFRYLKLKIENFAYLQIEIKFC